MSKLKRSLAVLLSAMMVFCFVPFSSFAAETAADDTVQSVSKTADGLTIAKSVSMDDSGKFVLDIEGYATGTSSTVTKSTPLDIVLLIDVSGSMKDDLSTKSYVKDLPNSSGKYAYSYSNIKDKYALYNGNYYKVYRDGGYLSGYYAYITVSSQRIYLTADGFSTTEATYSASAALWTQALYAEKSSKLGAMQAAVDSFIDSVADDAAKNKVVHKIALVTYGSSASRKHNLTDVSSSANVAAMHSTVHGLVADGATRIDLGFEEIGNNIFNTSYFNNTANADRSKVIIAFTDGVPTKGTQFDTDVANPALKYSNNLKKKNVKVYSIGLGLSTNNAKNFMNYLSSNYMKETGDPSMSSPGSQLTGGNYSKLVTDGEALKNVFQSISEEIIESVSTVNEKAVLNDTVSKYFNIAQTGTLSTKPDYEVRKLACTGADSAGGPKWQSWSEGTALTGVTVTVGTDKKTVSVQGFNYTAKENIVVPSKPAGNKLVIRLKLDVDPAQLSEGRNLAPTNEISEKKASIVDEDGKTAVSLDKSPVVDLYKVAVKGDSNTVKYSGSEQSVNTYTTTADFAVEGLSYSAKGTDADNYAGAFTGKINKVTYKGTDVTKKAFWSDPTAGSLTITKRDVTLTSADGTWTYDGKAHSAETVTPGRDGFVSGEGASYSGFPSVTNVSDTPGTGKENTFDYSLNSGTKAGNYNISKAEGKLKINQAGDLSIDVSGSGWDNIYDGQTHGSAAVPSVTAGTTVEYSVDGGVWTTAVPDIKDFGTKNVKARASNPNYSNTPEAEYTLNVEKRPVTLTSADGTWKYDGQAHQKKDVTVSGKDFVSGEGIDSYYDFPSVKEVSDTGTKNTFKYVLKDNTKAANYEISKEEGTLTINSADGLTIDVSGSGWNDVYDGAVHGSAAVPSIIEGTTVEYSVDGGEWTTEVPSIKDFGTKKVKARATNPNYAEPAEAEYTLNVKKRPVTLTSGSEEWTYDGKEHQNTSVTAGGRGFVTDEGTASYDGFPKVKEVKDSGTKNEFTYTLKENTKPENYDITTVPGTLNIKKAAPLTLDVSGSGYSGVYDGQSHGSAAVPSVKEGTTVEYSVDGGDWTTTVPKITNVGKNTVKARATNPNYEDGTPAEYTLEVVPKAVKVTVDPSSKVYGESDPAFTAKVSGVLESEDPAQIKYEVNRTQAGEDAGSYTVSASGTEKQGNYAVEFIDNKLTIEKRKVVLSSSGGSWTYDGTSHQLTNVSVGGQGFAGDEGATYSGFPVVKTVADTGAEGIPNKFDYELKSNTKAGNYEITQSYGKLIINDASTLTLDVSESGWNDIYDGASHGSAAVPSDPVGTTVEYSIDGGKTWNKEVPKVTDVADTAAVMARATNPNYSNTATGTYDLIVSKRPVTLTSADGTWPFDGKEHQITDVKVGDKGFVKGEGASYSGFPSVTNVSDSGTKNTFEYKLNEITDADNYAISVVPGTLTITSGDDLTLDVSKCNYSGKYDGASHGEAAVPSDPDGTVVEYSIDGGNNWTEEVPKVTDVADTAAVKVRATNPNYSNTAEAEYTLEVTKRKVTMTSADGSWTYDKQEHQAADVTEGGADGFISGEGASYDNFASIKNVVESDVTNTFDYELNDKAKADNYDIEVIPGKLTITKADPLTLDVTGSSYSGVYDGKAHGEAAVPSETDGTTVEYSVDGGDWTTEVPQITNVGKNTVKARATNPNYKDGDPAEYTLEVTPKDVTVTPDPAQKTYGDPDPELTATVTGVIDGEDPSQIKYELTRDEGENVGEYPIKASGDEYQGNYKVTYEEGKLTIGKLILDEENHFAYIIGYPDGTVGAEKPITRAEAATIFFRLLEKNSREGAKAGARAFAQEHPFKDVKNPNAWYYNAVYVLASNGIINGYPAYHGESEFKPDSPITRAEFATIASKFKTLEGGEAPFTDIKGHWAEKYIISAYTHGWINGYEEDNTFRPDNKIKRAEVANIVNNVLNRLVDKKLKAYSDPIDPEKMFVSPEASAEIQAVWNKWSDNNPSDWFYVTIQEATNAHDYSITKGTTDPTDLIEKWTKLRENENWAAIQSPDWLKG